MPVARPTPLAPPAPPVPEPAPTPELPTGTAVGSACGPASAEQAGAVWAAPGKGIVLRATATCVVSLCRHAGQRTASAQAGGLTGGQGCAGSPLPGVLSGVARAFGRQTATLGRLRYRPEGEGASREEESHCVQALSHGVDHSCRCDLPRLHPSCFEELRALHKRTRTTSGWFGVSDLRVGACFAGCAIQGFQLSFARCGSDALNC